MEFTEELQTSGGADLVIIGMEVIFSMHDLETVRDKKGEFLVTVVGGSGDYGDEEADAEKNYKVTKKHLFEEEPERSSLWPLKVSDSGRPPRTDWGFR